jgi:hypothetical protein
MVLDAVIVIVFPIWIMTFFVIYYGFLQYFKERRERKERKQRDAEDRRRQAILYEEYTHRNLYDIMIDRITMIQNRQKNMMTETVNWKEEGF